MNASIGEFLQQARGAAAALERPILRATHDAAAWSELAAVRELR